VDLKDIKAIIDLMKKNSISEFELERQDFKIRLKRGLNGGPVPVQYEEGPSAVAPVVAVPSATSSSALSAAAGANAELEIKSPMIGTFYRAPSPESVPYVEIGSEVNPESVVCIIEAMKVMNQIESDVDGVVTALLVENGHPVEYGQPLLIVKRP